MTGIFVVLIWFDDEDGVKNCCRLLSARVEKTMRVNGNILAQYLLNNDQIETLKKHKMPFSIQTDNGRLHSVGINQKQRPLSQEETP